MGKTKLSDRGEIFCPIKMMEVEPGNICCRVKEVACPNFGGLDTSGKDTIITCNHQDFDNCNPYTEINL